ncbi:hypothetical protein THIOM_005148 [Candidatus Thiomargarita nelsonii]|uniref:Uncharacterized protein n=1 Tax=Candidatus Thiomargarita nelsonii TaxID=1003181 RepID=A0A176RU08_9GAMM|nr:hypothetical protein THIOM_005148 [Candidatus Thiomargarita nelsonii]
MSGCHFWGVIKTYFYAIFKFFFNFLISVQDKPTKTNDVGAILYGCPIHVIVPKYQVKLKKFYLYLQVL